MNKCNPARLEIGCNTWQHWDLQPSVRSVTAPARAARYGQVNTYCTREDFEAFVDIKAPTREEVLSARFSGNDYDGILLQR